MFSSMLANKNILVSVCMIERDRERKREREILTLGIPGKIV